MYLESKMDSFLDPFLTLQTYNVKETTKILSFYAFFFVLIVTLAFVYGLVEITQNLFEGSIAGPSESEISSIK